MDAAVSFVEVPDALLLCINSWASLIRLASQQLEPVPGLHRLTNWVQERGFHRAAVTNAPRPNAEQMIAALGLTDFFEFLVIGSECERAKPFPDPYLKALEHFGVSPQNAFAIEVCTSCLWIFLIPAGKFVMLEFGLVNVHEI